MKKYFDIVKQTFITVICTTILSVLFSYLFSLLAVYCVLPNIAFMLPKLERLLTDMSDAGVLVPVAVDIGMLLGFIPAARLVFCAMKERRKKFIDDTDGLIPPPDGIISFIKTYGKRDAVSGIALLVISLTRLPSPFKLIYRMGIIPGLLLSALFTVCVYLFAVHGAQAKWRAEYFYSGAR